MFGKEPLLKLPFKNILALTNCHFHFGCFLSVFICSTDQRAEQSSHGSNMAELSPGAVGAGRAEHQAAINSMMLERMSTDISALKKQYSRIKQKQQQQAGLLYIHSGSRIILISWPNKLFFSRRWVQEVIEGIWSVSQCVVTFFPGPPVEAETIEPHQPSKQQKQHTGIDLHGPTMASLYCRYMVQ